MRRSLTLRLILSFLIIGITGAVLALVLGRQFTIKEFDRLVLDQAQSDFVETVTAYYEANGSWVGIAGYLRQKQVPPQVPPPLPQPGPQPENNPPAVQQAPPFSFMLVDPSGYVVIPGRLYRVGDQMPVEEFSAGVPVKMDEQVIGRVLTTDIQPDRAPREELYLARTEQALGYAALGAVVIVLLLGVVLARTLTRPLRELTHAIQAMAKGELGQHVAVRRRDELGELAHAFNRMSADLNRANELRRQMTADIAHDLRTPLTVITGYIEALRDGVLQPSPKRFETMYLETQHLRRLVEDLRTLSLADAGELTLNRESMPPQKALEQAAAAHRPQAEEQNIELRVDVAPELPNIHVDPDRLAQILGNLVSNALRYTPAGGQICLAATQKGNRVLLAVQDTGGGIPPDKLPHVFDRFYRGDQAREGNRGESGLGLTIARSVVELHGGTISVESSLGEGTTFTIALPIFLSRPTSKRTKP